MTKDLQSILQAPEWSMDDAYGSVGSEKWNQSIERAAALLNALHSMERPVAREALADHFKEFDEANTLISSLAAFAKCQGAKDAGDEEASAAAGAVVRSKSNLKPRHCRSLKRLKPCRQTMRFGSHRRSLIGAL